jgi:hypothetical protein
VIIDRPGSRPTQRSARRRAVTAVALAFGLAGMVTSTAFAGGPTDAAAAVSDVVQAPSDVVGSTEGLDVLQGQDAVDELQGTGTLDEVAGDAGMASNELTEQLIDDPAMFLTDGGMLGYADALPGDVTPAAVSAELTVPPGVDVTALSSRPSSSRVIYLDFDGQTTSDSAWVSAGAPSIIDSAPFDLDGVCGLSANELAVIYEVWQRVAEDYLPFDVNVTTIDPGVEGLRRTSASDQAYGQRMVISPTNWAGSGVLGIALLGVFDSNVDHPAFVFTSAASAPKTIAESVSHEAGHTFGLSHDGIGTIPYYDGHGVWAPIMGRSTSPATPVTQWSKGEYAGATNKEDDIAKIASYVGFRPDDHADATASATLIAPHAVADGVIGTAGDFDVFAVDVAAGAVEVAVRPTVAAWSNLLASVTVREPGGGAISSAPATTATGWTSKVDFVAPSSGRYSIEVRPSAWLTVSTGFSTYGSLGAYQVEVTDSSPAVPSSTPAATASRLNTITPTRLMDTRTGLGGSLRVRACRQVALQVTGRGDIPPGATAAVLSIVAVDPTQRGHLRTFPCSEPTPTTSTVNFPPGQNVANTTIATLSASGRVCIFAQNDADVVVDAMGWLGPTASGRFTQRGPERVMDTRTGFGGATRLAAGATVAVDFSTLPAGTTSVALNVTSVGASTPGFLTVYPCSAQRPTTSTVNFALGDTRPNNTIVGLAGGRVCIYSMSPTDVVVDLTGYVGPQGLTYLPAAPTRLLDTRISPGYIPAGGAVSYRPAVAALGSASAVAAAVNVTAVDQPATGFVTTYDCVTRRETSTLNPLVGQENANGAIVPLRNGLDSCLYTNVGGHLVVDLNGWWVR